MDEAWISHWYERVTGKNYGSEKYSQFNLYLIHRLIQIACLNECLQKITPELLQNSKIHCDKTGFLDTSY